MGKEWETHEKGIEAAYSKVNDIGSLTDVGEVIESYLAASNQTIVPNIPNYEMLVAAKSTTTAVFTVKHILEVWDGMVSAAPNPFPKPILAKPTTTK